MRIRLHGSGHAASLLAELNRCRQSRQLCDVLLQVGSRTFAAHRAVLACSGKYFRNLFARTPASATGAFSLEFISAANFEKVLMFIYTGEVFMDLLDVGVLYELAERLGVGELAAACHATFPDLQASVSAHCEAGGSEELATDPSAAAAAVPVGSAASACSSSASCSSLSSSAVPTPAAAPSPVFQDRMSGSGPEAHPGCADPKVEDIRSHVGFGQTAAGGGGDGALPPRLALQLKTEQEEEEATGNSDEGGADGWRTTEGVGSNAAPPDSSLPDSSAPIGAEVCDPTSSSGEPLDTLQEEPVGGDTGEVQRDDRLVFGDVEQGGGGAEEERWRRLSGEIIELSDDETFMEEEDEDEGDLVCLENGEEGGGPGGQVGGDVRSCKACSAALPADPAGIRRHAETHLTELGLCRVCQASLPDRPAAVSHALSHVGVQLLTCEMCHLQFCSQNKLLRHHRQAASCYTLPAASLTAAGHGQQVALTCAACSEALSADFQAVRDHLLSHVCPQSLRCGVCHLPQLSLCSLLWHALTHLALPIFSCPHCARCFVERPLLDRHMWAHAEEAAAREGELRGRGGQGGGSAGAEELHCFFCPQSFLSSSAFLYHLSLHTNEPPGGAGGTGGKRKADQPLEYPPSSCSSSSSQRDVSGLIKMSNLGFGPPPSAQSNGSSAHDGGAGAVGVRGKWYRCRYCGKHFAHSGEFTYHLRIHTGEKPYQCKVCQRFFRGRSTMICHLKTHAGALMYRCTVCGLYFSTLKLVSSHMELHQDRLPPDFNIEQTFMYNDHSKEPLAAVDG